MGNRIEGGIVCTILSHIIRKSLMFSENKLTAILSWKKPKSDQGLKPSLPKQNVIALPLEPTPLPVCHSVYKWEQIYSQRGSKYLLRFRDTLYSFKAYAWWPLIIQGMQTSNGTSKNKQKCLKETEKQIFLLTKGKNNFPEMHKINKMGSLLESSNLFVKVLEIMVRFNLSFFLIC